MKVCRAVLILVLSFIVLLGLSCGKKGPTISTTLLPTAEVGVTYSQTLAASGGTPPYTWSVTSGSLPEGLSLDSSTGIISGTPRLPYGAGQVTVLFPGSMAVVQVTDSKGHTRKKSLSIPIVGINSVTTESVNGLTLSLSLNPIRLQPGQEISVIVDEQNMLSSVNDIPAANKWPLKGLSLGP